jgi:spore maturation protein SpmA
MALNYIWIAFFLIGFLFALGQLIFNGDTTVFNKIVESTFSSAKTGFEISLGLTGVLTLWMGLMRVGEKGGAVGLLSKASDHCSGSFSRSCLQTVRPPVP